MKLTVDSRALALALALAPLPAVAQQGPPAEASTSDIVVTGNRNVEEQVRDFAGAMTPALRTDNVPRLENAVCPSTIGFSPQHKVAIERRLRQVAAAARIRVEDEGCTPNAVLLVTSDKNALIQAIATHHPRSLETLTRSELRRLYSHTGPAVAWHVEEFLTRNGTLYRPDGNLNNGRASRIATGVRRSLAIAILVIETRGLDGLTTTQIADYAAMRLFAETDPWNVPAGVTSILTAVDAPAGSEVPVTLSQWDLSFLRALHATPANLYTAAQRGEIARRMQQEMSANEDTAD